MHRIVWRQAAAIVLALVLIMTLARTAWTERRAALVDEELKKSSQWLRGTVILVDPGHGGDDPGAVVGGTLEKEVVLQVGLVLKKMLEEQGARVVMTREKDEDLGGRIREELGRRVALINKHKAHLFVSIHANKDPCNCWGAQTFFQNRGMPAGKALALAIQERLRAMTPTTRTGLAADFFVLRTSPVPAAMIEVGFLTNAREHKQLQDAAYQRTLASAVALGIADFLKSQVPEAKADGSVR